MICCISKLGGPGISALKKILRAGGGARAEPIISSITNPDQGCSGDDFENEPLDLAENLHTDRRANSKNFFLLTFFWENSFSRVFLRFFWFFFNLF